MPRYFFDIHADGRVTSDELGCEFPDRETVRAEAMRALPSIATEEVVKGGDRQTYAIRVRDGDGKPVYAATLTFAGFWPQD